jgi:hypothetical protein
MSYFCFKNDVEFGIFKVSIFFRVPVVVVVVVVVVGVVGGAVGVGVGVGSGDGSGVFVFVVFAAAEVGFSYPVLRPIVCTIASHNAGKWQSAFRQKNIKFVKTIYLCSLLQRRCCSCM